MTFPEIARPAMTPVDFDPFVAGELALTIPLTEPQKEIWTSVQMGEEANCSYNESVSLKLHGRLEIEPLREAFKEAVRRHEALRMTFAPDGVRACVRAGLSLDIPLVDLAPEDEETRDEKLSGLLKKEVETPFDLVKGPLIRVRVVKLAEALHQVLVTAHHIVCDGWSIDVLISDLAAIYSARIQGREPDLPAPDLFSDYVSSLARPDQIQKAREDEAYWLNQYTVKPPVVDLPTDRPRPALRTYRAGRLDWELPDALAKGLKKVGVKSGCTFLNVLLAGFAAFVHRLTGQDDIVIGLPAAGQSVESLDHLVGHCVNMLPLRLRLDKDRRFKEYLAEVRAILLDAHDHQRCTLGALIPKMDLDRDPSRIPLTPVAFNLDQGIDLAGMSFAGLECEFFSNPRVYDNFEFGVNVSPYPDRVVFECMFNSDLWDQETIVRRMEEMGVFLQSIADNPDQKIVEVPLLPGEEKERILSLAKGPFLEIPRDRTLVDLIEERAADVPESQAVCQDNQTLTYGELNNRANNLANFLMEAGVGPGALVGLCLRRCPAMIVGILGILKAGGGYVPLDPDLPAQRMSYLIEKAGLSLILADPETSRAISAADLDQVRVEVAWTGLKDEGAGNPVRRAGPDDPAYVIYTSGSTGRPKGVLVSHRSLISFIIGMHPINRTGPRDRFLQFAALWFDTSVHDIFASLGSGACLVLRNEEMISSPHRFFQYCDKQRVTQIGLTAAYLNLLGYDLEGVEIPQRINLVTFGGEAAGPEPVAAWRKKLNPRARLTNLYGPTEATVNCAYYEVRQEDRTGPVPVGEPQPNNRLYILDRHSNLCPLGVPGELHIGGPQVAEGYLNEPDLTAERFIPDPFAENAQGMLYKTGDIFRCRPDGLLEFLGRVDHQVKIRGFRIELGEVRAALGDHPAIQEAYLMVREDLPGNKNLTAYLVPAPDRKIDISPLKDFLRDRLPGYMIPTDFMVLERLPIASGGKIDRDALPSPRERKRQEAYTPPRNPTEMLLAGLFAETLKMKQVGLDDDFFELGGHSLLAVRLISRLEKKTGQSLPVTAMFEAPSVRKLARVLNLALGFSGLSSLVKIKSGRSKRPFFHIGQLDKHVRSFAKHLEIENPIYLIHVQPLEENAPLFTEVEEIAGHCLEEIKKVQPQGPYLLSGYCLGGMVAYEIAQRLQAEGQEIGYLALIESYLPGSLRPNPEMSFSARIKSMIRFHLSHRPHRGLGLDMLWVAKRLTVKCWTAVWDWGCSLAYLVCRRRKRTVPVCFKNEMVALGVAQSGFRPCPYSGRVYIFKAAFMGAWLKIDPSMGWGEFIEGEMKLVDVPGDHSSMYEEPHVREFAKLVGDSLKNEV